jgi:hypothetical protein
MFEKLDGSFVLFRGLAALERPEVASPPALRIDFARIEPILA